MRIAGKQVPWWWLAVAAGVVVMIVVAAIAGGGSGTTPGTGSVADSRGSTQTSGAGTSATGGSNPKTRTVSDETSSGNSGKPGSGNATGGSSGETSTAATGELLIMFWNDTVSKRPRDVEIVVGSASWRPKTTGKSDSGKLGPVILERTQQLVVYPDGRKGPSLTASIVLARDMGATQRDAVHVEIRDDRVRVLGNPVVNFEVTAPRD